jgi:hypothetical protein
MRGAVWLLGLAACAVDPPDALPLPAGDLAVFATEAQPVLDRSCADGTCHGRADRPFAIYSPGRRRADPARTFLDEPLTDEELAANARSVDALALDPLLDGEPIDACRVLCKPLAVAAGGCGHVGGAIFDGRDDRGYRGVRAYLETLVMREAP